MSIYAGCGHNYYGNSCGKCATEAGAQQERAKIVAYLEGPEFGEKSDWNVGHASEFAWLIKAKEHLK
jgi:hypothetical protein